LKIALALQSARAERGGEMGQQVGGLIDVG